MGDRLPVRPQSACLLIHIKGGGNPATYSGIACHTERIHSRPVRIALTREELREIVEHWRRQQNLTWSAQDTEDVVEFLGRTRYKFPSPVARRGRP